MQEMKGSSVWLGIQGLVFILPSPNAASQNLISFTFPGTSVFLDDQNWWSLCLSVSVFLLVFFLYVVVQDRNSVLLQCFCSLWSHNVPAHAWTSQQCGSSHIADAIL